MLVFSRAAGVHLPWTLWDQEGLDIPYGTSSVGQICFEACRRPGKMLGWEVGSEWNELGGQPLGEAGDSNRGWLTLS